MRIPLDISRKGPIATITLHRPDIHNAFDTNLIAELTKIFKSLSKEKEVRVVVLAGEGKHFCSGADLNWMKSTVHYTMSENQKDAMKMHLMLETIYTCAKPVIAKVQGVAFGGGAGLVAVSDVTVCAQSAQLSFSEVRLGILPSVISPFVIRKIGVAAFRAYGLSAKKLSADESLRIGLVQEVAPDDQLDAALDRWTELFLQNGPDAMAMLKELTEKIPGTPLTQAAVITTKTIAKVRAGAEGQEGMKAFLDKRHPSWRTTR